jgi:hypothetical protein
MNRTVKISLRWLVDAPTGQSPRGQRFVRPARFEHQGQDWTSSAWSLCINTEGVPDAQGEQSATAKFLMDDAPHDWLSVGKRFMLYENIPLAEGVVKEIMPG